MRIHGNIGGHTEQVVDVDVVEVDGVVEAALGVGEAAPGLVHGGRLVVDAARAPIRLLVVVQRRWWVGVFVCGPFKVFFSVSKSFAKRRVFFLSLFIQKTDQSDRRLK